MDKNIGVLFPVSAMPSRFGIGDFGIETYRFIDMLKDSPISVWQILPMHPSLQANSPYRAISCYAGDEVYISLERLVDDGLLDKEELVDFQKDSSLVEYDKVRDFKHKYLVMAYNTFSEDNNYREFIEENTWVENFAIFKVFATICESVSWYTWPDEFKKYPNQKNMDVSKYKKDIDYQKFIQYIFYKQWNDVKTYANNCDIQIFGDMPFYVDVDSTEVWLEQESFLLDALGEPTCVAGVPPDYFSETGQNWGNPIYNWEYLQKNNFEFWVNRLRWSEKLFNLTRIDHFRAFDTYWKIPVGEENAIRGVWAEAPGYAALDAIFKQLPDIEIIAEDLGDLRKEVIDLKNYYGLKGMKVFQFQMNDGFENMENTLLYTGTHDNETIVGWFKNQDINVQEDIIGHVTNQDSNNQDNNTIHLDIIRFCLTTNASDVIIPIWDLLGLDNHARFNIPGTTLPTNWRYRINRIEDIVLALQNIKNITNNY